MVTPRVSAGSAIAAAVWALGAWCSLGTVAPVSDVSTVARVGVLPPWWVLPALALPSLALVAALRLPARAALPLYLGALALLPWIPGPVPPAFLVFAGPLGMCAVIAGMGGAALGGRGFLLRDGGAGPGSAGRVRPMLVVLVAVVYVLAAWRMSDVLPGGDEPHYLVITQSLIRDGDLRIENNHQRQDYRSYVDGELRPDYLRRGRDGQIYSIHAPGLAVLVLPAFAIGGYAGAVLWLALLSAVGGWLAWRAAFALTSHAGAAMVGWSAVALSVPFFFQAFTLYPDGPAALIVLTATWGLVRAGGPWTGRQLLPLGLTLAALPWLHTRFAALAGAIGAVYAIRVLLPDNSQSPTPNSQLPAAVGRTTGQRAVDAAWLFAPAVVSLAGWLWFFAAIYGVADPRAPYGHATNMRLLRIPHGLSGLVLDQQFGLLPNAPVYLLAFLGLPALWRYSRRVTLELLVMTVPYAFVVAAHHMWWGGRSSPARFLVPVLLPAALPIAAWWARYPTRTPRTTALVLLTTSLALTAVLAAVDGGALTYNSRDGFALWLDAVAPAVNAASSLPSLFRGTPQDALGLAAIWLAALAAVWGVLRVAERHALPAGPWYAVAGVTIAASTLAALTSGWFASRARALEPGSGLMAVAAQACRADGFALRLQPFRTESPRGLAATLAIPDGSRRPAAARARAWFGRDVPPGRYRLLVRTGLRASGTLDIALGRRDQTMARCVLSAVEPGGAPCTIDLPAGAVALWLIADAPLARSVDEFALQPVDFPPEAACGRRAARVTTGPEGSIFVIRGRAFVEGTGLWTAGESEVDLVVAPRPTPSPLTVRVRNGPVINGVVLRSGDWEERFGLGAGAARTVRIPRRPEEGWGVPLAVFATAGFVPAAVDPASRDTRWLGVWLELAP